MLSITVQGLDEARRLLTGFSDRRFSAAVATALTRTASAVQQQWRADLREQLDRPERLTLGAPLRKRAEAASLTAEVFMRDQVSAGATPPSEYLATQEQGGGRNLRKFERALVARGSMPAGHHVVPGQYAQRDAYGNISRGQIVQVLNQLGAAFSPGYARVIGATAARRAAAAARAGQYIAVPKARGKLAAGVYRKFGGDLLPVFFFAPRVSYPRRTNLLDSARRLAAKRFPAEMNRAISEHIARLAARAAA